MSHTPADWYPSPESNEFLQYWDGEMWTDRMRPATVARPTEVRWTGKPGAGILASEHVADALEPDERIVAGYMGSTGVRKAMIAATDTRILFIRKKGLRSRRKLSEIRYEDVTDVRTNAGGAPSVRVIVGDDEYRCYAYDLERMTDFAQFVRLRIAEGDSDPSVVAGPPPTGDAAETETDSSQGSAESPDPEDNLVDQLERLAALHDRGALTAEEFASAKVQLLTDSEGS